MFGESREGNGGEQGRGLESGPEEGCRMSRWEGRSQGLGEQSGREKVETENALVLSFEMFQ